MSLTVLQVTMLEKLANAVNGVEHRKQAYGRSQSTEKFEYNSPHVVDLVQVSCGSSRLGCV